jgi:hypothetical protein
MSDPEKPTSPSPTPADADADAGASPSGEDYSVYPQQRINALQQENADLRARAEKAEVELSSIDALLARRPAIDGLTARYDKINKALSTANRADRAERDLATAREALARYGRHRGDCAYDCKCGLSAALQSAPAPAPAAPTEKEEEGECSGS